MQSSQFNLVINSLNADSFSTRSLAITTQLTAQYNIQNAALAASICIALGNISANSIIDGLKSSNGAPGRLEKITLPNGAIAFVDYAHTPDALEKALLACKSLLTNEEQKLICVFGCGGDRDKSKRAIMGKIAENISNIVVITDDNPRTESSQTIISEILQGISNTNNIHVIPNRSDAIKFAAVTSKHNDIILVAGKGHENYQIIGTEKHHFSDQEELLKIE
jgi:UDP-N-acetylmuramoyl-L-alanyl-D-glutamate--2,6-diaminopimelate ligase